MGYSKLIYGNIMIKNLLTIKITLEKDCFSFEERMSTCKYFQIFKRYFLQPLTQFQRVLKKIVKGNKDVFFTEFDIVCPVHGKGKMSAIYFNLFPAVSVR